MDQMTKSLKLVNNCQVNTLSRMQRKLGKKFIQRREKLLKQRKEEAEKAMKKARKERKRLNSERERVLSKISVLNMERSALKADISVANNNMKIEDRLPWACGGSSFRKGQQTLLNF